MLLLLLTTSISWLLLVCMTVWRNPLKVVPVGDFASLAVRLRVRHLVEDAKVNYLTFVCGASLCVLTGERLTLRLGRPLLLLLLWWRCDWAFNLWVYRAHYPDCAWWRIANWKVIVVMERALHQSELWGWIEKRLLLLDQREISTTSWLLAEWAILKVLLLHYLLTTSISPTALTWSPLDLAIPDQ